MEFSNIYNELHEDIVNYRVLTEEQIKKLESLTPSERLSLLKVYNEVVESLKDFIELD